MKRITNQFGDFTDEDIFKRVQLSYKILTINTEHRRLLSHQPMTRLFRTNFGVIGLILIDFKVLSN